MESLVSRMKKVEDDPIVIQQKTGEHIEQENVEVPTHSRK